MYAHVSDVATTAEHERSSLLGFAARLAALLRSEDGGLHGGGGQGYFVPISTLTTAEAAQLGITCVDDLFGGVVPHSFVASKAISHPLVGSGAAAVIGWNDAFAPAIEDIVLPGFTVFAVDDARIAAERLLARGPLRVKKTRANAGRGQFVASDLASLETVLRALDPDETAQHGLVLEENLCEMSTFSVGQVRVPRLMASYVGTQRQTRNNRGATVYGGSDLMLVRGGFDELLEVVASPEIRQAIAQAMRFHVAAQACFPGLYMSRANYDILMGRDAQGAQRSAVLEQSWRVGGATGAEIAALEVFLADPAKRRVRASCFEIFGASPLPPPHAVVYFRGIDPDAGALTKYTVLRPDDNPR
ncbi:hypothetical protein UC35_06940 [Ramlibacter tataouinensis]|uniref:Biotin carboxylase n=1 Tax=Ramlibacter tataouinensis TaxID=94132 RepID=A0A127JRU3_9BURK|nr:hypothetical protein UC35_06940 [Ramlibacter tataouinensis]